MKEWIAIASTIALLTAAHRARCDVSMILTPPFEYGTTRTMVSDFGLVTSGLQQWDEFDGVRYLAIPLPYYLLRVQDASADGGTVIVFATIDAPDTHPEKVIRYVVASGTVEIIASVFTIDRLEDGRCSADAGTIAWRTHQSATGSYDRIFYVRVGGPIRTLSSVGSVKHGPFEQILWMSNDGRWLATRWIGRLGGTSFFTMIRRYDLETRHYVETCLNGPLFSSDGTAVDNGGNVYGVLSNAPTACVNGQATPLPFEVRAISGDGNVRIGESQIFTIDTGAIDIASFLVARGLMAPGDLTDFSLTTVSRNGRFILGTALLPGSRRTGFRVDLGAPCDSTDFNNDGLFPDAADLEDLFSVFGGGACSTGACNDIDFNNDGLYPDNTDLAAYLRVFTGGAC